MPRIAQNSAEPLITSVLRSRSKLPTRASCCAFARWSWLRFSSWRRASSSAREPRRFSSMRSMPRATSPISSLRALRTRTPRSPLRTRSTAAWIARIGCTRLRARAVHASSVTTSASEPASARRRRALASAVRSASRLEWTLSTTPPTGRTGAVSTSPASAPAASSVTSAPQSEDQAASVSGPTASAATREPTARPAVSSGTLDDGVEPPVQLHEARLASHQRDGQRARARRSGWGRPRRRPRARRGRRVRARAARPRRRRAWVRRPARARRAAAACPTRCGSARAAPRDGCPPAGSRPWRRVRGAAPPHAAGRETARGPAP